MGNNSEIQRSIERQKAALVAKSKENSVSNLDENPLEEDIEIPFTPNEDSALLDPTP